MKRHVILLVLAWGVTVCLTPAVFAQRGRPVARPMSTFSRPVNMARFDRHHWTTAEEHLWYVAEYLFTIRHHRLFTPAMVKNLHRLDGRSFRAGRLGSAQKPKA